MIRKLADDTTIGRVVDGEKGCQKIQQNIDQLGTWAKEWQVEFILDKGEVLQLRRSNVRGKYRVNGKPSGSLMY